MWTPSTGVHIRLHEFTPVYVGRKGIMIGLIKWSGKKEWAKVYLRASTSWCLGKNRRGFWLKQGSVLTKKASKNSCDPMYKEPSDENSED